MRYLLSVVVFVTASIITLSAQSAPVPSGLEACLGKESTAIQQNRVEWEQFCLTLYEAGTKLTESQERLARVRQKVFDGFVALGLAPETARAILRSDVLNDLRALAPAEPNDVGAQMGRAITRSSLVRDLAAIDALVPTPQSARSTSVEPETRVIREPVVPVFLPTLPRFELPQLQPYVMQPVPPPPSPLLDVICTSYRYGTLTQTHCQ